MSSGWKQDKMNPEIKSLWVAALRSGKYKQGRGTLRNEQEQFCCLGVLCNLHAQAHPEIAAKQKYSTEYLTCKCYLPDEVIKWSGVRYNGGIVSINRELKSLADHNDSRRTFEEIAKAIEEQL
jgi:hypothetical protein